MKHPIDSEGIWSQVQTFQLGSELVTSGLDVLFQLYRQSGLRISAQIPALSYFENGILTQEDLPDFLAQFDYYKGKYILGEGDSLGENPQTMISSADLQNDPSLICLLYSADEAHPYRIDGNKISFFQDDQEKSLRSNYQAFESYLTCSKVAAVMKAWSALYDAASSISSKSSEHEDMFTIGNVTYKVGSSITPIRVERLEELAGKLVRANNNPLAQKSIQKRITALEETPDEFYGYLPTVSF